MYCLITISVQQWKKKKKRKKSKKMNVCGENGILSRVNSLKFPFSQNLLTRKLKKY